MSSRVTVSRWGVVLATLFFGASTHAQPAPAADRPGELGQANRLWRFPIEAADMRPMPIERSMTRMQALAPGGGVTQRGTVKDIKLHWCGAYGKMPVLQPKMGERLQEGGDVVHVKEGTF